MKLRLCFLTSVRWGQTSFLISLRSGGWSSVGTFTSVRSLHVHHRSRFKMCVEVRFSTPPRNCRPVLRCRPGERGSRRQNKKSSSGTLILRRSVISPFGRQSGPRSAVLSLFLSEPYSSSRYFWCFMTTERMKTLRYGQQAPWS